MHAAAVKGKGDVSGQLDIEVSALGSLDYFHDHKRGMEMAGRALGVRTEYVGPADYDMNAMANVFESDALHGVSSEVTISSIVNCSVADVPAHRSVRATLRRVTFPALVRV